MKRALLLLALVACKERGTARIHVTAPTCEEPITEFVVYAVSERACDGECVCGGACFAACEPGQNCALGCGTGFCPIAELGSVTLDPPAPGPYAVVFEFFAPGAGTARSRVGFACANVVLDADGTDDLDVDAPGMCCL